MSGYCGPVGPKRDALNRFRTRAFCRGLPRLQYVHLQRDCQEPQQAPGAKTVNGLGITLRIFKDSRNKGLREHEV